jgi:hypothetical protein
VRSLRQPYRSVGLRHGWPGTGWVLLVAEQALAEVTECVGAQPGDVHLGDAELLADLGLRHVVVKAHQQDLLLTGGQLAPVHSDGSHVKHVLKPAVLLAEDVGQGGRGGLAGQRRVQ